MTSNFVTRRILITVMPLVAALILTFAPALADAQESGADPAGPTRLEALGINPTIAWQSEYENNVYRRASDRIADVVSILTATTGVRRELRRVGLNGNASAEWMHFATLERERGANVAADLKIGFLANRLAPYVGSSYQSSRRRLNREIDSRPRIEQSTISAGSVVRVGAKTSLDLYAGRTMVTYATDALNDGVDVGDALNRTSHNVTFSLAQEVTPLTRITVASEMRRDQFNVSSSRNADYMRFTTGFESDGKVKGRARVGLRVIDPHDRSLPKSRGLFAAVGTSVTILDRLQISVDADRDLAPSYRRDIAYYESYAYGVGVSYAMRRSLRLSAMADRRIADYRTVGIPLTSTADGTDIEIQKSYGSGISYLLGTSVSFNVSGIYTERTSTFPTRGFDGMSLRAGVIHAF